MATSPEAAGQPLAIEAGASLPKRPTAQEVQGRDPVNRVDTIAARLKAATPGPWEVIDGDRIESPSGALILDTEGCDWMDGGKTADLIAHAPADIATLLAFARSVEKLAQDAPHNGPFTAHGYTARLRALLAVLDES